MAYVADLHIHSKYAGACSKDLDVRTLSEWAKYKGVDLLGTGDALHPYYQNELKKDLKDIGGGIYECNGTKFIITAEISCIYSEDEKLRRIHILLLLPSLDSAFKISESLQKRGAKLSSDGRPVLGMSARQLCNLVLLIEPKTIIIPAHVWTPWFSLYGSKSGYNSIKDCFGEYEERIYAVETGLSSEPSMNWRVKELDNKSIVSFSDLHSPPRLGRECTIIGGQINYQSLENALKTQNIIGTIEFFPEEGKYHYTGHRNCGVAFGPDEVKKNGTKCPKCKKELTIGVLQRVEELADRTNLDLSLKIVDGITNSEVFPERAGFRMLIQLEEIIAQALEAAIKSVKVQQKYKEMVSTIDTELKILTKTNIDLISMVAGEKIAEGIKRVREGNLKIEPGYDNTYGVVKIWGNGKL